MPAINLPFFETIKRSFMYVMKHFDVAIKISSIWFLLLVFEMFTGFGSACVLSDQTCESGWKQNVSSIVFSIANIAIITAYIKNIILKTAPKYGQLVIGKIELKYFAFSILFLLMIVIPASLTIVLISFFSGANESSSAFYLLFLAVILAFCILMARLYLKFPAIAVGNADLAIKKAFLITKGNAIKLFFGQFVLMLPVVILYFAVTILFATFALDGIVAKFCFVFVLMCLSFLDACLKGSYYAHVYQYFMHFSKEEK